MIPGSNKDVPLKIEQEEQQEMRAFSLIRRLETLKKKKKKVSKDVRKRLKVERSP